jgi:tetrahydromethanopterin S-methyltransferase subunit C
LKRVFKVRNIRGRACPCLIRERTRHFLLILGVSTAVSGVPCPSLAVTGVFVAAEVGTGVGVLRFDILMVIVPVLEKRSFYTTPPDTTAGAAFFWRVSGS